MNMKNLKNKEGAIDNSYLSHDGATSSSMRVETISFLKQNAANLPLDAPLVITQNGVAKYHVESYGEKAQRDEAIALLKLTALANKDLQNGNAGSVSSFRSRLAERKQLITERANDVENAN